MNGLPRRFSFRQWVRQSNRWFGLALASALFLFPLLFVPLSGASQAGAWQPVGLRGETVLRLAVVGSQGQTLMVAQTATGLWRSAADFSGTRHRSGVWQRIDNGLPSSTLGVPELAAWRNVPGRPLQLVALAGPRDARQLYRTDDGGVSWRPVGPAPGQTRSPAIAILPGVGDSADSILIATLTRVQLSVDGGATWAPGGEWPVAAAGSEDPVIELLASSSAPDRLLALARPGALWISGSGGLSWHEAVGLSGIRAVASEPSFGLRLWAAGDEGVAFSADGGATWTQVTRPGVADGWPGDRSGRITAVHGDPRVLETVYAAARDGAVYRSDDEGRSWQFLGAPGSTHITALALEGDQRSVLVAATDDGISVRRVVPLQPTPSPTVAATSVPTETATATATQTPTSTPTVTATSTVTPSATASPTATATSTATATPRPTRRPTETPTASPTLTVAPTGVPPAEPVGPPGGGDVIVPPPPDPVTPPPR